MNATKKYNTLQYTYYCNVIGTAMLYKTSFVQFQDTYSHKVHYLTTSVTGRAKNLTFGLTFDAKFT